MPIGLYTLSEQIQAKGSNKWVQAPPLFTSDGSSLTGWTNSGVVVDSTQGNPTSSLKAVGGTYAYRDLGQSFLGKTITLDMYILNSGATFPLCNFYFGCNSTGQGNLLRLEGRSGSASGFATTTSWTSWNAPATGTNYTVLTWYTIVISINSSSQASWSINGSPVQTNVSVTLSGNYFGVHGDGVSVHGGLFDNITIVG